MEIELITVGDDEVEHSENDETELGLILVLERFEETEEND